MEINRVYFFGVTPLLTLLGLLFTAACSVSSAPSSGVVINGSTTTIASVSTYRLSGTPAGGNVTLRSHVNDTVQLIVEDTGACISPENLPYVFDRFYQSEKSRLSSKGKMGLGLAICKALTEAMGCSIEAYSAGKDQGTKMVITLKKVAQS